MNKAMETGKGGYARRRGLWVRVFVLCALFVAYSLQTSTLTLQSLWFDEVMALEYTRGGFIETVRTIVQPHHNGPLFYLLLFGWRQVVGDSDFAVRFLSVILAVLTMPLLFQWARKLLTDRTAVTSVWLFACSPFVFWFAQEAKMYALHMLVSVASSLALLEAFRKGGWWRWLLYAVLVSTVLYSHFFGVCLVASQAAMALLLGWRRWKRLLAYGTAMLSLGLAHLPLVRFAWGVLQNYQPRDIWRGFVPLDHMFRDAVGHYFYRLPVELVSQLAFLLPAGLIFAGGLLLLLLLWLRPRPRRVEAGVILLHACLPMLIYYAISFRIPIYWAKYLSAILPALFVLVAWGVEALSRLWRPAAVLILVLGMLMVNGLARDLTDPKVQRDNWRFAADYVDAHEGANDLVLIFAHYTRTVFERYYRGDSDFVGFGENPYDPWPAYQRRVGQYDRLWLVLSHDQAMAPGHQLHEVAAAAFPVITEQFPSAGRIRVIGYQMRYEYPTLPEGVRPLDVCFQNGLCLAGYQVDATDLTATERISHPPSNWIHAVLYWRREPQVDSTPFRPLVRLVDGSLGVWGGDMERRPDLFDRYPPEVWPLDVVVETHFDMNLNPVTPPGTYRLEVSLAVEGDENRRVTVVNPTPDMPPDRFLFEAIHIQPSRLPPTD
jgi:4-amino-4-deoxy-L-arabinose transferase-like glycosyltransferase